MMQTVVCDGGCGKSELTSILPRNRSIQPVKMVVLLDPRDGGAMPDNNEKHEADLCEDCRTLLLSTYFRVKENRILEIPKFLEQARTA